MTKEQAYIIARKELWHKAVTAKETRDRAMGIFAEAFSEWKEDNWIYISLTPNNERKYIRKCYFSKESVFNISELIAEFEKID